MKVIMGIGIPGSGKTSFLKPFAEENEYIYISPDEIRAEIDGAASVQTSMRDVWDRVHFMTADALDHGKSVVVDATFAKDFERKDFIAFAREHGAYTVQGVFAAIPYEIALERNNSRERKVPEYALERMQGQISRDLPSVYDGFDAVFDIDEFQKLKRAQIVHENHEVVKQFKPFKNI